MSIVKLCALGYFNIDINFTLRYSEADLFKFEISEFNSPIDLKKLFFPEEENDMKINYFDYISLSSKNDFINTILFINRAFKNKIFIEFIMLNQMNFRNETYFLKNLIKQICIKNYIFLVENRIFDLPTSIKFNIKIIEDDNDDIIAIKSFELFENNVEVENDEDLNLFEKINYNFSPNQYFLSNFSEMITYSKENYDDISIFFQNLILYCPNIKIITIFNKNSNKFSEIEYIDLYKDIIEYSDIIFSDKTTLNEFYENYYKIYNNYISNFENLDFILKDRDKKRKGIERNTILMEDNLENFQIYIQKGLKMEMIYNESFSGKMIFKNNNKEIENENKNIIISNKEIFNGIFIGSFLSRLLNGKLIKTCIHAACLSSKNMIDIIKNNIDYITDIDLFNVVVPMRNQSSKKNKLEKEIYEARKKLYKKEKGFVLDCTNKNLSQKKDYNPLLDMYCQNFVFNKRNFIHLRKLGFINKNGNILKDPELKTKNSVLTKINFSNQKNKNMMSKTSTNFFSKTNPHFFPKNFTLSAKKINENNSNFNRTNNNFYQNEIRKDKFDFRVKTGFSHNSLHNYKKNYNFNEQNKNITFKSNNNNYNKWNSQGLRSKSISENKIVKNQVKDIWNPEYIDKFMFNKILETFEKKIN